MDRASDIQIREYARAEGFSIVTKDADFSDLCVLHGFPPKIIWIRRGNCSAKALEDILSSHQEEIYTLEGDPTNGVANVVLKVHQRFSERGRLTIFERRLRDASDRNGFVLRLSG